MRIISKRNSFHKFWSSQKFPRNFLVSKVRGVFQTFYKTLFQPLTVELIATDTKMESDPSMEAVFHPAGDDLSVGKKVQEETEEPGFPARESNGTNGSDEGCEEVAATPHIEPEEAKAVHEPGILMSQFFLVKHPPVKAASPV
jgi:hypothetical protein